MVDTWLAILEQELAKLVVVRRDLLKVTFCEAADLVRWITPLKRLLHAVGRINHVTIILPTDRIPLASRILRAVQTILLKSIIHCILKNLALERLPVVVRVGVLTSFCLVSPRQARIESIFLVVICVCGPIHGRRPHRHPKTGMRPGQRLLNYHAMIQLCNGASFVDACKVALEVAPGRGRLAALMRVLVGPLMVDRAGCKAMWVDSTLILLLFGLFNLL